MPYPLQEKHLRRARYGLLAVGLVLVAPIVVYVLTFGLSISADHTRWSEMGSAMAGIYAPILALLTLVVLLAQVQLEGKLNEHTFDQSYIRDARADLHFFLEQLAREIALDFSEGSNVHAILVTGFAYRSLSDLQQSQVVEAAKALNRRHHRLVAMWSAVYGIFAGLKSNDYPPYSNNYSTTKQKVIAVLSYDCCAALDNLTWVVSEGRLSFPYEFSDVLPSSRDTTYSSVDR